MTTIHLPSFLIGAAVGATGVAVAPRIRPLALEIATTVYRSVDYVLVRVARVREDFSDLLAEARARARGLIQPPQQVAA
ncbi:MAG: hypothetical protein ACTHU0_04520 [Kofleriaceae bacterium]